MTALLCILTWILGVMAVQTSALKTWETNCTFPPPNTTYSYVSAPNTRGTTQILWSSLATVIACTYFVLHLNIPKKGSSLWKRTLRDATWSLITVIAPEVILGIAVADLVSAYKTWKELDLDVRQHWTLTHMFYADMGGLYYCARANDSQRIEEEYGCKLQGFLVDAGTVRKGLRRDLLPEEPPISKEEILDKSKSSAFTKAVAIGQLTYFCFGVVTRAAQRVPITQLELAVSSFVVCSVLTYALAFLKPKGVAVRTEFHYGDLTTFEDLLSIAAEWPQDGSNHLSKRIASKVAQHKLQHFSNDLGRPTDTVAEGLRLYFIPLISISVGAIHLAGWNLHFHSLVDKWLWRSASVVSTAALPAFALSVLIFEWLKNVASRRNDKIWLFFDDGLAVADGL